MLQQSVRAGVSAKPKGALSKVKLDFKKNYELYIIILPVLAFYILFHYKPMYGALIAFQNYNPLKGIWGSKWVGFANFIDFFNNIYFWRLITNTLTISISSIIVGFPAPIILALMINEVKNKKFARVVQSVSYMPHFISLVVICSMIINFTNDGGFITSFAEIFGYNKGPMMTQPNLFVPVYVLSGIWQEVGWGSIIYIAALAGVDQALYDASKIDGAGRWKQMLHVTLPGISPTIIIMFILRMGNMLNVGFEKIILLYNSGTYSTADVISSYVYRMGIEQMNFSFSTAVGLFNSAINIVLLVAANWFSKKVSETSLW